MRLLLIIKLPFYLPRVQLNEKEGMSLQQGIALPLSLRCLQRHSLPIHGSKLVYLQRGLCRPRCGNTSTFLLIWQRFSFICNWAFWETEGRARTVGDGCVFSSQVLSGLAFFKSRLMTHRVCTCCLWQPLLCFWGCSAGRCAVTLLLCSKCGSFLNKKGQTVVRSTLQGEFQMCL